MIILKDWQLRSQIFILKDFRLRSQNSIFMDLRYLSPFFLLKDKQGFEIIISFFST